LSSFLRGNFERIGGRKYRLLYIYVYIHFAIRSYLEVQRGLVFLFFFNKLLLYRNLPAERVDNALSDAEDIIGMGVWAFWEMVDRKIERLEYATSARGVTALPSSLFLRSADTLL
jgi:hypothetical protein